MGFLSAIGDFVGGIGDAFTGGLISDYFNRKQEKRQHKYQVDMWNMQNEYNHPANQMERLRQAGLNPQLALDSNVANTAGSVGSMSQGSNSFTINTAQRRLVNAEIDALKKRVKAEVGLNYAKAKTESNIQKNLEAQTRNLQIKSSIDEYKLNTGIVGDDIVSNVSRSAVGTIDKAAKGVSKGFRKAINSFKNFFNNK